MSFAANRRRANGFVQINKKNVDHCFEVIFDCSIAINTLNNVYTGPNSRCVSKWRAERVLGKGRIMKRNKKLFNCHIVFDYDFSKTKYCRVTRRKDCFYDQISRSFSPDSGLG